MSTTFWQTMAPMVVVFSQRPRRGVILAYDARRRRIEPPASATARSIASTWVKVAAQVVIEDASAWLAEVWHGR